MNFCVTSLRKGYSDSSVSTPIIEDFSLHAELGEILAIVGPSGCGKTTLLKLFANILEPEFGSVEYDNKNIEDARRRHLLGYIPQTQTLLPNRSVAECVSLPLEIAGRKDEDGVVARVLRLVGLEEYSKYYPHQLSGGMKQKVSIAQNLVYDPKILLLDEPFASLDQLTREHYNEELHAIFKSRNCLVILVTHSIEEAVFMSDRVIVLSERPAKVIGEINIAIGDRNSGIRTSSEYFEAIKQVRALLK